MDTKTTDSMTGAAPGSVRSSAGLGAAASRAETTRPPTIRDFARLYQRSTGVGLPFSQSDSELLVAMERSFREREGMLRELQGRDYLLRQFIGQAFPPNGRISDGESNI